MNKYLNLLTGVALAGFASSAVAADLPARVSPVQPYVTAPVANWTGFYVGGGSVTASYDSDSSSIFPGVPAPMARAARGWFGTVQVGWDVQFPGIGCAGVFATGISLSRHCWTPNGRFELKETSAWAAVSRPLSGHTKF